MQHPEPSDAARLPPASAPAEPEDGADGAELRWATARVRRVVASLAALLAAAATVAVAFAPWLLVAHPLWLAALAPDGANLVLVSATVDLLPLLALALPMRILGVSTAYTLGLIYGAAALGRVRSPRLRRLFSGLERALDRVGAPLLVVLPAYTLALLAGAARLGPRRAGPAIVLGQGVAVVVAYGLGSQFAPWTDRLIQWLGDHLLVSTLCCAAGVLLWRGWRRMRAGTRPG